MEPVSSLSNLSPTQSLPHHHVGPAASGVKEGAPDQSLPFGTSSSLLTSPTSPLFFPSGFAPHQL